MAAIRTTVGSEGQVSPIDQARAASCCTFAAHMARERRAPHSAAERYCSKCGACCISRRGFAAAPAETRPPTASPSSLFWAGVQGPSFTASVSCVACCTLMPCSTRGRVVIADTCACPRALVSTPSAAWARTKSDTALRSESTPSQVFAMRESTVW